MKKVFCIILLVSGGAFAGKAQTQGKTGYISIDEIASLMPETGQVDSLVDRYRTDSVVPVYTQIVKDYQAQMLVYNDSLKTTATVHQNAAQELGTLSNQINNWEQIQNQALTNKRNSLLRPIYAKIYAAIKAVAKEKGIAHVVNKEVYLVAPDSEDLLPAVAVKLKIVLPKSLKMGLNR